MNDLERLFYAKIRLRPAHLESRVFEYRKTIKRLRFRGVLHDQLASLGRYAQLTRCFSAVAMLLVYTGSFKIVPNRLLCLLLLHFPIVVYTDVE